MNSTATVYEQYYYSDNCPLPFSKTREMKKKKRKKKKKEERRRRFQCNPNGTLKVTQIQKKKKNHFEKKTF